MVGSGIKEEKILERSLFLNVIKTMTGVYFLYIHIFYSAFTNKHIYEY